MADYLQHFLPLYLCMYNKYPKILNTQVSDKMTYANSVELGSKLFAILLSI